MPYKAIFFYWKAKLKLFLKGLKIYLLAKWNHQNILLKNFMMYCMNRFYMKNAVVNMRGPSGKNIILCFGKFAVSYAQLSNIFQ